MQSSGSQRDRRKQRNCRFPKTAATVKKINESGAERPGQHLESGLLTEIRQSDLMPEKLTEVPKTQESKQNEKVELPYHDGDRGILLLGGAERNPASGI